MFRNYNCFGIHRLISSQGSAKFKSLFFLSRQCVKINQNLNFDQWECSTLKLD